MGFHFARNLGLKAHIPCYGGVGCNDLRLEGEAAVYAGNFCWADAHRSLQEKGAKQAPSLDRCFCRVLSMLLSARLRSKQLK